MSGLGALTMAWIAVEAAMPLEWRITGLTLNDFEAGWWTATAADPSGGSIVAVGSFPEAALQNLATKLREIRGSANG